MLFSASATALFHVQALPTFFSVILLAHLLYAGHHNSGAAFAGAIRRLLALPYWERC